MSYTLGRRQQRAYTDVVDLYKPDDLTIDDDGVVEDTSKTLAYSSVKCHLEPKSESSTPEMMGRTNTDYVITTDKLHFHIDQEVGDLWAVQLKTPGHPEYGTWYQIQGGPQNVNWRAKKKILYAKRSLAP